MTHSKKTLTIAIFLFISGFCSLAYQIVWLRDFRLIFGGSTTAASAVLAVFMGALGYGGYYLGKKIDHSPFPARYYSKVELSIAISVLFSPLLLIVTKNLYYLTGGVATLGYGATLIQILLTLLVLGVPCFLMGGTLPAAIATIQDDNDEHRQATAALYGINIAGAVSGAFLVNFYILEMLGNTITLVAAGLINLLLGICALPLIGRSETARAIKETSNTSSQPKAKLIYSLAFVSGFIFFVVEILWFRTSIPLLGGSVYNFGLILVIALAGMSLGGLCYSILIKFVKPSLGLLAIISALFTLCLCSPFLLGDSFAQFSVVIQSGYSNYPFESKLWVWFIISSILVLPTAFMAGMQFPLFLSLIGKSNDAVASQVGKIYGFNTAGAVSGSILGGFIMIPVLSIPTSWKILAWLSILFVFIITIQCYRTKSKHLLLCSISGLIITFTGYQLITAEGLTGYWQQNPIGFGRALYSPKASLLKVETMQRDHKRSLMNQFDGRELSGSLSTNVDLGLLSNGKSDGSAKLDAGTQIMLGLTGAILHQGEPKNACVIGLGTGTSAGWLAEVQSIKEVDVIELEPQLIEAAKYYSAVNFDVVNHSKVNIIIGDARETLMVNSKKDYDLIASEPSNPQRAGVANLYTQEFYESVYKKLNNGGIFTQWLQAYEIDYASVRLILSTLDSVFPQVEVFQSQSGDLVFICRKENDPYKADLINQRMQLHPFKSAIKNTWGVSSTEAFFAHYVANANYVKKMARSYPHINTDDLNTLEFDLGKSGGSSQAVNPIKKIFRGASEDKMVLPKISGRLNQQKFEFDAACISLTLNRDLSWWKDVKWLDSDSVLSHMKKLDVRALTNLLLKDKNYSYQFKNDFDSLRWAQALAATKNPKTLEFCEQFKDTRKIDYHALRMIYYYNLKNQTLEGAERLLLLEALKTHVWCNVEYLIQCIQLMHSQLGSESGSSHAPVKELFSAVADPYPCYFLQTDRLWLKWNLAQQLGDKEKLNALMDYEPYFPLKEAMLKTRIEIYTKLNHPNLDRAKEDLTLFHNIK